MDMVLQPSPAYFAGPTAPLLRPLRLSFKSSSFRAAVSPTSTTTPIDAVHQEGADAALVALLRAGDTDAAYRLFASTPSLPESAVSASRLLAQLSYKVKVKGTSSPAFSRAAALLQRLRANRALALLDANSLSLAASAAARSGNAPLAYSLLLSMLRRGLLPDRRAYTAAVSRLRPAHALRLFDAVLHHLRRLAPAGEDDDEAQSLPDTAAFNAALSACADAGDPARFRRLFEEMRRWGPGAAPDALTYNIVIKMCARAGRKDLVAGVLPRILSSGLAPCATTFHSLVAAYVGFGDIPTAERIVQAMRDGRRDLCSLLRSPDAGTGDEHEQAKSAGSDVLEDIVGVSEAAPLLGEADVRPPSARVYTTLMKGYMNAGRVEDVMATLRAMRREGESRPASRPDTVAYTTAVSALAAAGDMERARALVEEMPRAGVPASRVTYNVLLRGYCRQRQMAAAAALVESMPMDPDAVTYNTLMDGCVEADDTAGAVEWFGEMRRRGVAPTAASYTTVMKAFAVAGQPATARRVLEEMERDPRVEADVPAWNMAVEAHCRAGQLEAAKRAVEEMKARGLRPDVATYGSLAKAIAAARRPGEALVLWAELQDEEEKVDVEALAALADVFVKAALFRKALEVVARMEAQGMAPERLKARYKKMYVELHSRMFTSRHASQARQDRRRERKRAAEAFKFWLGLPNSYYHPGEWQWQHPHQS